MPPVLHFTVPIGRVIAPVVLSLARPLMGFIVYPKVPERDNKAANGPVVDIDGPALTGRCVVAHKTKEMELIPPPKGLDRCRAQLHKPLE